MKRSFFQIFSTLTLLSTVLPVFAETSICSAPLNAALMTVKQTSNTTMSSSASTAWQCSFKYSNHDEAISGGLDIGAVVYGVPLQVGGKFDQKKINQWKDENCSKSAKNESFVNSTYTYLREVAPDALKAFSECIRNSLDPSAIECELTREPAYLKVKWRKLYGEPASSAPKVQRVMVTNGKCEPILKAQTVIQEGGIGTTCTVEAKKDLMVMVQTTRGICATISEYPEQVYNLVGTVVLNGDRKIVSDVVDFSPDVRIITNGRSLSITADKIRLQGSAEIRSFDAAPSQRAAGASGMSGGALLISADQIEGGGELSVDLSGQDGVIGRTGDTGSPGSQGRDAAPRGHSAWFGGCKGGHDAERGGAGEDGKTGGTGGNGGDGGTVLIALRDPTSVSKFTVVGNAGATVPGQGGQLGGGGPSGPGGSGGAGAAGKDGCGGRDGAGSGPQGNPGNPGKPGEPGKPGIITIQNGSEQFSAY